MDIPADATTTLILGFVLTFVAAYFGALLAVRKYRGEKQWAVKHAAYQDILNSISAMHAWADDAYGDLLSLTFVDQFQLAQLTEQYEAARLVLRRRVHLGELTFSQTSIAALEELLRDIGRERFRFNEEPTNAETYLQDYSNHCIKVKGIIANHLPKVLTVAKKDLS
jgi:hypothetical protein